MRQLVKFVLLIIVLLLVALPALAQTATPIPSGTPIGIGDTINGSLTLAQPSTTYTLDAEAGQAVIITLTSPDMDTYLTLQDGNGRLIAENDDYDGTNSRIQSIVLPQASSYNIIVESYGQHGGSGAQAGSFTLTVAEQHIERIEYSQTIQSSLTQAELTKDYVFTGQAGDAIMITLNSNDFNSYLHLLDSSGSELISNDDSGGSLNSLIGPYTLPSTGSYTIRASSLSSDTPGAFTLSLNKIEVTAVTYDEPIEVNFTPTSSPQYFTFEGDTGDLITVTAVSDGKVNTSLTLNDPYNSQVVFDDDSGPGLDPEIYQLPLNQSGTYTLALQMVAPGTGKVTVTVQRTPPPSLDDGPQTVTFTNSQSSRVVMFTGNAGEHVRLTMHSVDGRAGSPNLSVLQNTSTIASGSGSSVSDLSLSFVVPSDGNVVVQLNEYSYNNLSFEVTLGHSTE